MEECNPLAQKDATAATAKPHWTHRVPSVSSWRTSCEDSFHLFPVAWVSYAIKRNDFNLSKTHVLFWFPWVYATIPHLQPNQLPLNDFSAAKKQPKPLPGISVAGRYELRGLHALLSDCRLRHVETAQRKVWMWTLQRHEGEEMVGSLVKIGELDARWCKIMQDDASQTSSWERQLQYALTYTIFQFSSHTIVRPLPLANSWCLLSTQIRAHLPGISRPFLIHYCHYCRYCRYC